MWITLFIMLQQLCSSSPNILLVYCSAYSRQQIQVDHGCSSDTYAIYGYEVSARLWHWTGSIGIAEPIISWWLNEARQMKTRQLPGPSMKRRQLGKCAISNCRPSDNDITDTSRTIQGQ